MQVCFVPSTPQLRMQLQGKYLDRLMAYAGECLTDLTAAVSLSAVSRRPLRLEALGSKLYVQISGAAWRATHWTYMHSGSATTTRRYSRLSAAHDHDSPDHDELWCYLMYHACMSLRLFKHVRTDPTFGITNNIGD
jgi:hypothetical protein